MCADDVALLFCDLGSCHHTAGRGSDLPGQSFVGKQVGTIREDVDDETRVTDRHYLQELAPGFCGHGQCHDAFLVLTETQLTRRAEHPLRCLAANLPLLDFHASGKHSAYRSERIKRVGSNVGSAADDIEQRSTSSVDLGKPEVIGVGVLFHLDHPSDQHIAQILPKRNEVVNGRTSRREQVAQLGGTQRERHERAQPLVRRVHRSAAPAKAMDGQDSEKRRSH